MTNQPVSGPIIIPGPDDEHSVELEIQRQNTTEFILADPVALVLHGRKQVQKPSGGHTWEADGAPRGPYTYRLIPASDRMPEIKTSSGRLVTPVYILLAEWDGDIRRWDMFELNGVWFEIASPIRPEHTERAYQLKGDVVRREDA